MSFKLLSFFYIFIDIRSSVVLKSVYIYRSYRKFKTGGSLFGPLWSNGLYFLLFGPLIVAKRCVLHVTEA